MGTKKKRLGPRYVNQTATMLKKAAKFYHKASVAVVNRHLRNAYDEIRTMIHEAEREQDARDEAAGEKDPGYNTWNGSDIRIMSETAMHSAMAQECKHKKWQVGPRSRIGARS